MRNSKLILRKRLSLITYGRPILEGKIDKAHLALPLHFRHVYFSIKSRTKAGKCCMKIKKRFRENNIHYFDIFSPKSLLHNQKISENFHIIGEKHQFLILMKAMKHLFRGASIIYVDRISGIFDYPLWPSVIY